jgi:hypothetical protein
VETFSRETLDPWYVTGFIEGAGTFTYSRSGRQINLYFAVKLTAADQLVLEALRDFFGGIGRIYRTLPGGAARGGCYFRVTRQKDLERVILHLDQVPLKTARSESYRIWREMVILKRSFRKPPREQLEALARQLSEVFHRRGAESAE